MNCSTPARRSILSWSGRQVVENTAFSQLRDSLHSTSIPFPTPSGDKYTSSCTKRVQTCVFVRESLVVHHPSQGTGQLAARVRQQEWVRPSATTLRRVPRLLWGRQAAVQRCEACSDDEEGCLYLCAQEACFDKMHPFARKHRKSLVAWDSKAKWADKCCATHKGNVLALWCALCCLHGEHTAHKTNLVSDVWKQLQGHLRATMDQLEDDNAKNRERLRQLKEEQDELASGNGTVDDARRALHEVKALFLAKVDALDGELDLAAATWPRQAAEEHRQLAQHTRSVDAMRATCAEEKAEEAQRVVIARNELCAQRDALGSAPSVSVRAMEFDRATSAGGGSLLRRDPSMHRLYSGDCPRVLRPLCRLRGGCARVRRGWWLPSGCESQPSSAESCCA